MPIITGSEKNSIGTPMGSQVDSSGAFSRVESMLTPEMMRSRFLFGIPMWSFLPDPISGKRQEYTSDMQKDAITRAINRLELHGGFSIQPVQKTKRLPFDRLEYQNFGYFQLPDKPITSVISLMVKPAADLGAVYVVNPAWIDPGQFQRGQVTIIPYQPATAMAYSPAGIMPVGGGGSVFLATLGQCSWVPSMWEVTYICGFDEGRVPVVINELIGTMVAINILSELGATNRRGNYSVGMDGASQSVSTGGPNVYSDRIKQLLEDKAILLNKLRKKFGFSLAALGNV